MLASALLGRHDPVERRTITDNALWAAWRAGEDAGLTNMTPADVLVNRTTAMGLSAVWACVGLISDSVATLPVAAVARDGNVEKSLSSQPPWMSVPNPEQTKVDFIFNQISSLLLHGYTPVYTIRDRKGDVVEAYALDPTMVQIRREYDSNGQLKIFYYISVGKGQQSPVGAPDVYRVQQGPDMFHIVGPQIHAGYPVGLPPLEVARMMYGGAIAAQESGARFYGQGMIASGVIEHPEDMTIEQARELKQDWRDATSGRKRHHLPPVLTGGAKFNQVTVSPEAAQFLQTREFSVDEIARWFRVPPHMIGHLVRSTSWGSGIEFQNLNFVSFTLRPWIERLESAWTRWMLIFQPGATARFDVTGLLRGDHAARATYYQARFNTASITPNEIRAAEGEAPIEGGDEPYYPINMAPLSASVEQTAAPADLENAA